MKTVDSQFWQLSCGDTPWLLYRLTSINKLDILVTGEKPGPEKLKKAEEFGIKIMSWEEFIANYIEIG